MILLKNRHFIFFFFIFHLIFINSQEAFTQNEKLGNVTRLLSGDVQSGRVAYINPETPLLAGIPIS